MALSPEDRREIESCLAAAREGELSADQAQRLAVRVKASDEFAWLYVQLSHLEAALRWDYSAGSERLQGQAAPHDGGSSAAESPPKAMPIVVESDPADAQTAPTRPWGAAFGGMFARPPAVWFAAAALMIVVVVVAVAHWWPAQRVMVAHLTKAIECQWAQDGEADVDDPLHTGDSLLLHQGMIEITYLNGARVLVEGPAEFRLTSSSAGQMALGILYAVVPPNARGFTIDTPRMKVVDLGTEFGVLCRASGDAEVHVFAGKVDVSPGEASERLPSAAARQLSAGEALLVEGESVLARSADRSRFISPQQPRRRAKLVGFYPFDGDAHDASGRGRHATRVANAKFVPGHEGQAAEFNGMANSYIDLPIDARVKNLPRMTWGAWVKPFSLGPAAPGSLGERNHEILSTDNSQRELQYGRVLTLDLRDGTSELSGEQHRFATFAGMNRGVFPDPESEVELNRWTFVAATYDQPRRMLLLYVEQPEAKEQGHRLLKTEFHDTNFGDSVPYIRVAGHALGVAHPYTRLAPLDAAESFHGAVDNVFVMEGCLRQEQLERIVTSGGQAILEFGKKN